MADQSDPHDAASNRDPAAVYVETDGMVVFEAESTASPLGLWSKKTAIDGYTGSGYLEFSGNEPASGPAKSPLVYRFRINKPGLYDLHLRCARQEVSGRKDWANDCYVRIEGNYGSGPNAGHRHQKDATLSLLKSDTKFFGGDLNEFVWASGARLDPGGKTNKRVAVYDFQADETYQLVVSGRSQFFKLDRILLRHRDTPIEKAEDTSAKESKSVPSSDPVSFHNPSRDPPAGRLALVTDGNAWDPDDVCATPVALALVKAAGLEKRLVFVSHSCELKNKSVYDAPGGVEEEIARRAMNQESCDGTAELWGGFEHLTFWNCRTQREQAVADMKTALNASTSENPLWIIEAGEPDIIFEAAIGAKPGVMQHVYIITHHPNNDRGIYHDLDDLLTVQSPGAKVLRITDQNRNLKTPLSDWHWARDHADPKINWLWQRGEYAANQAFKDRKFAYGPIQGKFDASDAGMVLYWLTGAYPNGLQQGTPADIRRLLTGNNE